MLGMHPPFFQGVLVPLNMTTTKNFGMKTFQTKLCPKLYSPKCIKLSKKTRKFCQTLSKTMKNRSKSIFAERFCC